jgi:hypothetical protein
VHVIGLALTLSYLAALGMAAVTGRDLMKDGTGLVWSWSGTFTFKNAWAVLAGLLFMTRLLLEVVVVRWLPRRIPGRCARCGYDLTGNVSGRCPECGGQIRGDSPPDVRN